MLHRTGTNVSTTLREVLCYGGNMGSVSMFMAHGGANFAFWAGCKGGLFDITSYDYDCPVSEDGSTGQPGIGGKNKLHVRCGACHVHGDTRHLCANNSGKT